jgi:molybdate transport system permease protein
MIGSAVKLSFLVVSVAMMGVSVVGIAMGYLLAKRQLPAKTWIEALFMLPMVLPPTVTGYYLLLVFGRHGVIGRFLDELTGWTVAFHWTGAALAAAVMALPIMVRSARAAFESVDPHYEIASRMLGKGEWETFFRISLPLAWRGIGAGFVLSLARALGEFGATLLLAGNIPGKTQTMPLAIYEAVLAGEHAQARLLVGILTGISIVIIALANRLAKGE